MTPPDTVSNYTIRYDTAVSVTAKAPIKLLEHYSAQKLFENEYGCFYRTLSGDTVIVDNETEPIILQLVVPRQKTAFDSITPSNSSYLAQGDIRPASAFVEMSQPLKSIPNAPDMNDVCLGTVLLVSIAVSTVYAKLTAATWVRFIQDLKVAAQG